MPQDTDSHLARYVEDLRRIRETVAKMAGSSEYGRDAKLRQAAHWLTEAAALIQEARADNASRTETFLR